MHTTASSTTLKRNRWLEFRQAIYDQIFTGARDALFETLDPLLLCPGLPSFVERALVPVFRRRWPSLYAALADGALDPAALEPTLLHQIADRPVLTCALDSTVWPHPQARTLPQRQFYPLAGAGKPIVAGHSYSLLAFVAAPPLQLGAAPSDRSGGAARDRRRGGSGPGPTPRRWNGWTRGGGRCGCGGGTGCTSSGMRPGNWPCS